MKRTLDDATIREFLAAGPAQAEPTTTGWRPVHTVYGGAHLFTSETIPKLSALALRSFHTHAATPGDLAEVLGKEHDAALIARVHGQVAAKLSTQAIEDYRIDFEDGYGFRADEEEDGHAVACAEAMVDAMANNALPPGFGFRVKSFGPATRARALRTLDLLLTTLADHSVDPLPGAAGFAIALPKVQHATEVVLFTRAVEQLEHACGFAPGSIHVELMAETPRAIIGADGRCALPELVAAADGRCVAVHFGAYDFTSRLDVTAASQTLHHDSCIFARQMMTVALAGTAVQLVDGATNVLPIEPHGPRNGAELTDAQRAENRAAVHGAWRASIENITRSLAAGYFRGWDLHPAQIPARYMATYLFFLRSFDDAARRLRRFLDTAAQATRLGAVFDDAATGQGLLNSFLFALDCGAIDEAALDAAGLTLTEARTRSFTKIVAGRTPGA